MQRKRLGTVGRVSVPTLVPLLVCLGSLPAQETPTPSDASQAAGAAETWLELIDGGRYESAWKTAGEELRSVVTVRAWERRISSLRRGIGALRSRALASTQRTDSLPGGEEGDYVVVTFDSSFGTLADAVETVIVSRQEEGAWAPIGYFVQPARSGVRAPGTSRPTR